MTPQIRIRQVLRDSARLEDAAVRVQLRILRATRRDILARLVNAGAFDRFRLTTLLQAVDAEISRGRDVAQAAAGQSTGRSYDLGSVFTRSIVSPDGMVGTSQELLRAVVDVTTDQVRDVWGELGSKVKTTIRRATLGVSDPFEAMKTLSRSIRDPKTFGRALWRAEAIVRTEVGRAFSVASQSELERGARAGIKVRKYWLTARDERVRDAHVQAGRDYGEASAIPHDDAFIVDGEPLMFPGDPNGSASNTINCRCYAPGTLVRGSIVAASKAFYSGPLWRIETARGHRLTVTPNHPVLTALGWLPAHTLREGDDLLSDSGSVDGVSLGVRAPHDQHGEALVEDLFESFRSDGGLRTAVVGALDFHGDAARFENHEVYLASPDRGVLERYDTACFQRRHDAGLGGGRLRRAAFSTLPAELQLVGCGAQRHATLAKDAIDGEPATRARGADAREEFGEGVDVESPAVEALDLGAGEGEALLESAEGGMIGPAAKRLAVTFQGSPDRFRRAPESLAEFDCALPGLVQTDKVSRVLVEHLRYRGPIYNVQTRSGLVHSNGIITHNCVSVPVVLD